MPRPQGKSKKDNLSSHLRELSRIGWMKRSRLSSGGWESTSLDSGYQSLLCVICHSCVERMSAYDLLLQSNDRFSDLHSDSGCPPERHIHLPGRRIVNIFPSSSSAMRLRRH